MECFIIHQLVDDVWSANVNDGETKGKTDNPKHCIHCKNVKDPSWQFMQKYTNAHSK